jgi:predicted esterase
MNGCMMNNMQMLGVPDAAALAKRARKNAEAGSVDPIASIAKDRVYLFAGVHDAVVAPAIVAKAAQFYREIGLPEKSIRLVTGVPAGHAFVTETEGEACELSTPPYVAHCNYDQAGDLLAHIYNGIAPPDDRPAGTLTVFDQREFTKDLSSHGMAETGSVYVPKECAEKAGCRIHVAFHGCGQNRAAVGDSFVKGAGFARWADANRIVVLYPEAAASFVNTQGCWDWWGYTGKDFLTRKAPQIVAVRRMLDRLAARRG